jgi:hypothetical protein
MLDDPVFRCNRTKLLGHLVTLGCIHQEKVSMMVYGKEGLDALLREYSSPEPPVYEYTVKCQLPVWIRDVVF